jgi:LAO/AO transport system ATPase
MGEVSGVLEGGVLDGAVGLHDGLRAGDRRSLARAISALEDRSVTGEELAGRLRGGTGSGSALVVGLTGPPGAGKSTLLSALTTVLVDRGRRVAVLMVDPSSPVTSGAVLGDRIRFQQQQLSGDVFVRSLSNRGHAGGLTAATADVVLALEAAGFDTVLIETVGAGQSEVAVTGLADVTICATPPGLGDAVQAIKAGIVEVADLFVVTKSDLPGAEQVSAHLRRVARRRGDDEARPIIHVTSRDTDGVTALADELESRRDAPKPRRVSLAVAEVGRTVEPVAPQPLAGRVALVTGASSGLGRRFAQVLHGAGATVVAVARRAEPLADLAAELGERIVPVSCDVTSTEDIDRLMAAVGPRLDILVNNAGMGDVVAAEAEPIEQFRAVVEVNLVSVFALSQRAARIMLEQGSGSIINIASALGLGASYPIPQAGYSASKAGVVNLTRELGAQWASRGVRVNAIAPGWFRSEMTSDMFASDRGTDYIRRNTPIRRPGEVDELDGALLFLAGDASSYVVGQTIVIDGGWTVH